MEKTFVPSESNRRVLFTLKSYREAGRSGKTTGKRALAKPVWATQTSNENVSPLLLNLSKGRKANYKKHALHQQNSQQLQRQIMASTGTGVGGGMA